MVYDIACTYKPKENIVLKSGESFKHKFYSELDDRYNYKLRIRGEVAIPYVNRTESVYPLYFRKLEDSLIKINEDYALRFDEINKIKERSCYYMYRCDGKVAASSKGEFSVKYQKTGGSENLKLTFEIYYGTNKTRYYYEKPDKVVIVPLEDSEDFTVVSGDFVCDAQPDFIMVKICGTDFDGTAKIFAPTLDLGNGNVIKGFSYNPDVLAASDWIGEGFSLTEKPMFTLSVNGAEVFKGHKYDRLNRFAGCEFDIPSETLKKNRNEIEIYYSEKNHIPYVIAELQLIKTPKRFEILGVSPFTTVKHGFGALCYFPEDTEIWTKCPVGGEYVGTMRVKKGVNALKFVQKISGENLTFKVLACGEERSFSITVYDKSDDGVLTGSGDFIYINQNLADFTEYLAWYLNNGVGNMLTLRSAYRWGMTAEADETFWRKAVSLLNDVGLKYVLMVDGRELNGINANPSREILNGKGFLGEQTHEQDGAFTYWGKNLDDYEAFFISLLSRKIERWGICGKNCPVYDKFGKAHEFYTGDNISDMKEAYETMLGNLTKTAADGATRHTGVTPYFHIFLKAGYKWVGYESMYGPHELMLGALRGMSQAAGLNKFGSHLALQWGSLPCDDPMHSIRYRLALYLSYMHGVSDINTEEGLWNIETSFSGNDRNSYACKAHLKEQADFYRFTCVHERKGLLKTNIAMMVGLYDGMDCFSTNRVYGCYGKEWEYASPEKSWGVLKTFYPKADINAIYYFVKKGGEKNLTEIERDYIKAHGSLYKGITDYRSLGYYSDTPYGVVDIINAEAQNLSNYKFIFFAGWNTCTEDQLVRLITFMKGGGILMLTKAHLYDTVVRSKALSGNAKIIKSPLLNEFFSFEKSGNLVYFDKDLYPADMLDEYTEKLRYYGNKFGSKHIKNVNSVSFTEYKEPDGSTTVYLLDIDWWKKSGASCTLCFDGREYPISLDGNKLRIVNISQDEKIAAMYVPNGISVKDLSYKELELKGYGKIELTLFSNGSKCVVDTSESLKF